MSACSKSKSSKSKINRLKKINKKKERLYNDRQIYNYSDDICYVDSFIQNSFIIQ